MIGEDCFDNLYTGHEAIVFMNNIEDNLIQKLETLVWNDADTCPSLKEYWWLKIDARIEV